jgi:uncharacterized protein YacL
MNCFLSGIVGLGLLGASISTMSVSEEQHDLLRKSLSDELDRVYEKIIIERRNHYVIGLVLGIALSFLVVNLVKINNRFHKMSLFLAITFMTGMGFYSVMPKSDYMLNHLKTEEQNKAWLEVYKTMKHRHILGFFLGALAAIPLAYSLC